MRTDARVDNTDRSASGRVRTELPYIATISIFKTQANRFDFNSETRATRQRNVRSKCAPVNFATVNIKPLFQSERSRSTRPWPSVSPSSPS